MEAAPSDMGEQALLHEGSPNRWRGFRRCAKVSAMQLNGWNVIPEGYGVRFEVDAAPLWMRVLFRTPFIDRFAYPLMVRRGLAYLSPLPGDAWQRDPSPAGGWRIEEPEYRTPGSVVELREHGRRR